MAKINLRGEIHEFENGITIAEIANFISNSLYKSACCGKINGKLADLRTPITEDCSVEICTFDSAEGKKAYWHTTAHIFAQAVQKLYPNAKFGIGPAIENGFYYDIDVEPKITPEDLPKIESEMKKIIKEDIPLEKKILSSSDALQLMTDLKQDYKIELINEHAGKGEEISIFEQGDFLDLCAGPHLLSTSKVKALKLTSITGAYWRADANNKMLQRIYGISFPKASLLDKHLTMLEEAKRRDHRKLGKELELFSLMEEGPGFPFFLPKGMMVKNLLIDYWRKIHSKAGYQEISTPIILSRSLWEKSGHWSHYKENMYTTTIDDQDFAIKPMNCPGSILVYKTKMRSYKDFPLRMGELGIVHRHELSGALHGLMRVRCFTQDDAHIFLMKEQIKDEIKQIISLIDDIYSKFNFKYHLELSTMPDDHIGELEDWEMATNSLKDAMTEANLSYKINEGDGAFYGPKIDFHLKDCLGRTWQCGTIQLDFQLPERFELEYTGSDGVKHRPIMIHRVAFGSIERFIGILIEHFAGAFPFWLSPVQVRILPISDHFIEYAKKIQNQLVSHGFRTEIDERNEKVGYKIRESQMQKIPYTLIVGEKEQSLNSVSVRQYQEGDKGIMELSAFIDQLKSLEK